jgi:hypothetical protein
VAAARRKWIRYNRRAMRVHRRVVLALWVVAALAAPSTIARA